MSFTRSQHSVLGAVLAGGRSARMGEQDKCTLSYQGESLLERATGRARGQVSELVICSGSASHRALLPQETFVEDTHKGHLGPAAGIISAFHYARHLQLHFDWLATFACDTPFFPTDLVATLIEKGLAASPECQAIIPVCNERAHYVFTLWAWPGLAQVERHFMNGEYALKRLIQTLPHTRVELPAHEDTFFNINTPEQWRQLQSPPPSR